MSGGPLALTTLVLGTVATDSIPQQHACLPSSAARGGIGRSQRVFKRETTGIYKTTLAFPQTGCTLLLRDRTYRREEAQASGVGL